MFGVGVGAMALIMVLSAFNGINSLVEGLYSSFDAEIRIEAVNSKTFYDNAEIRSKILSVEEVAIIGRSLEETVLIKYKDSQTPAMIKGVDSTFMARSGMDSLMWAGDAELYAENGNPKLMVGYFVAEKLGLFIQNALRPMFVYAAKSDASKSTTLENAFYIESISPSGVFAVNQDIDAKYTVAPIEFVEMLLQTSGEVTAYELQLHDANKAKVVQAQLQEILGSEYEVKTRFQQNEILYKTNNTEKWATFLILSFILLIATFNVIGSLTILILDKKRDIFVLRGMGATLKTIRRIFFVEGLLISLTGGFTGLGLGILLVFLQSQFGFIPVEGLLVEYYPVELQLMDVISISTIIIVIGSLAAMLPSRVVLGRFNIR